MIGHGVKNSRGGCLGGGNGQTSLAFWRNVKTIFGGKTCVLREKVFGDLGKLETRFWRKEMMEQYQKGQHIFIFFKIEQVFLEFEIQ